MLFKFAHDGKSQCLTAFFFLTSGLDRKTALTDSVRGVLESLYAQNCQTTFVNLEECSAHSRGQDLRQARLWEYRVLTFSSEHFELKKI